jgi:hypothetical protein
MHKKKEKIHMEGQSLFLFCQRYLQKRGCVIKRILKDLVLLIVKNNVPIQFVENMWLKRLILHPYPKLNFPSKSIFHKTYLPRLVEKTNELCVHLALAECHFATMSFNLWMFKGAYDVFALVINFLSNDCCTNMV